MQERELRHLIEEVRAGALPRRSFIQQLVGLGLSAPMASMLLMHAGVANAQTAPVYKPTKRGGGGALRVLWWQGATLLQPHFANGTKDQEGSRIFYESLGAKVTIEPKANGAGKLIVAYSSLEQLDGILAKLR
jgi:peptide/nickel transport system substrate-binding protein